MVLANNDPTCHGEMEAIRAAGATLGRPHLTGCIMYSSAQPCPMCAAAAMWAHLDRIYYAATYEDVKKYGSFDDAKFDAELKKPLGERIVPAFQLMRDAAVEVWEQFAEMEEKCHY